MRKAYCPECLGTGLIGVPDDESGKSGHTEQCPTCRGFKIIGGERETKRRKKDAK